MLKIVSIICRPLLVGLLLGMIAGMTAVYGAKVLKLNLSSWQEYISFFGFVACFGFFGLVDSANRLAAWLRSRKDSKGLTATPVFSDGNITIEWVNRETLRYSENEFAALVWVDYDPRIFNNERIIKTSSIVKWEKRPEDCPESISSSQKKKIIDCICDYYRSKNKPFRVEE